MAHRSGSRAPSHDRWLVSYADFITLLFAFFATLYAISTVDLEKQSGVARALQAAFDDASGKARSTPSGPGLLPGGESHVVAPTDLAQQISDVIQRHLADELSNGRVIMSVDRRGVVLSVPEAGFFAIGSDELSPTAQGLIARIGETLKDLPNQVRVEGHTDDLPIHTPRFRSNWDLSTARATRVIEFLIMSSGVAAERLSAAGYAEFRPRATSTSEEARRQNRRVDLVILNETTSRAEEPPGGRP